jgi:hypothetical protein
MSRFAVSVCWLRGARLSRVISASRGSAGQATLEWAGVLAVVALILTALVAFSPSLTDRVASAIKCSVAEVLGDQSACATSAATGPARLLTLGGTRFTYDPSSNAYLPPGVTSAELEDVGAPAGDQLVGSRSPAVAATFGKSALDQLPAGTEVQMPDGSLTYYASGSSGRLSAAQVQRLQELGVPESNIVRGRLHAEMNILRALPEGAIPTRWGIAWAGANRALPCPDCAPSVPGTIEGP